MKKERRPVFTRELRAIAWMFIGIMVCNVILPVFTSKAYAGGPTQPEVQSFSPISVTDMVDPFTGDFHYNIPLMDIEGYPINLVYNSGVSMDQEASWVGLGWNLNTGAIVRNLRGLPDEFNGDIVEKEVHEKPTINVDLGVSADLEIFGKEIKLGNTSASPHDLNVSISTNYNNYNGFGAGFSFGPSYSFATAAGASGMAGFQLNGSSENGASWNANVNFSKKVKDAVSDQDRVATSTSIGGNTRAGLQYFGISRSKDEQFAKLGKTAIMTKKGLSGHYDIGLHTYSPTAQPNMRSGSFTGTWKMPVVLFGADATLAFSLGYSKQWIPKEFQKISSPAYGYFSLESGQSNENALLDFNRDNDGSFTKTTPFLPSAHLTPDIFSVQAQGIDGSFRGFRQEVGFVFDPLVKTLNNDGSLGIEVGEGNLVKVGVNVSYSHIKSESGAWDGLLNTASNEVRFSGASQQRETYALQNASESSVEDDAVFAGNFNNGNAVFFPLAGIAALPILKQGVKTSLGGSMLSITDNARLGRYKRNQALYFRTVAEVREGMGIEAQNPLLSTDAKDHHIGELTELATDGRRYVFGLPVYNTHQEEVSFAVGGTLEHPDSGLEGSPGTGLVSYSSAPNAPSSDNDKGIDNFYSSNTTPPYAHSFMLTSILSDDYIDNDDVQGPSVNDLGTYVKFDYQRVPDYEWRTPFGENQAYYNAGLKTDPMDDRGSFVHGKKDLMYVQKIETKNYVAVFTSSPTRTDAPSSAGRDGGAGSATMLKLDKIELYARPDYEQNGSNAIPIQSVNFLYDYQLCAGFQGTTGKLTLTEVYFTYQKSSKKRHSGYKFAYSNVNPAYNMRDVDRWGNYQAQSDPDMLTSSDFPYTRQDNKTLVDQNASAWLLTQITLPSGGSIDISYESDDYAYVQHLPAMRMYKIRGNEDSEHIPASGSAIDISTDGSRNKAILVEMNSAVTDKYKYAQIGQELYFRCLVDFNLATAESYEYISGYGKVSNLDVVPIDGVNYLKISFVEEELRDGDGTSAVNPITKSAIQYGRMHMSRYIQDVGVQPPGGSVEQHLFDFANSMIIAMGSFSELFTGPNIGLYSHGKGKRIMTGQSFIRLQEPTGHKLGGGSRVREIVMHDNWEDMGGTTATTASYGQHFEYTNEDGTSSGVASYEPQVGGDENPWHSAVHYSDKKIFAPDDQLYVEKPLMESQFPSPVVGYSRVVITDLPSTEYHRTSTGKVVKEFYTAKDFPVRVVSTDADIKTMNNFLPIGPKYQYLTASQGFSIELNDMHGKPKSEQVFAVDGNSPISKVEYFYKTLPAETFEVNEFVVTTPSRLDNQVTVINPDATYATKEIGVKYEGVADFRRNETTVTGGQIQANLDGFLVVGAPITVPTVWPKVDISDNQFRSATMNKIINRFGVLDRTVAAQDGSIVETRNLAFDSETGDILVTETTTDFNDKVYSLKFPAYWTYGQTAAAYSNINFSVVPSVFSAGIFTVGGGSYTAGNYFYPGDELEIRTIQSATASTYQKGWVTANSIYNITVVDKAGDPVSVNPSDVASGKVILKIIRSGHRNKQTAPMMNITMLENPIAGNAYGSGTYSQVLNAGAVEFSENWRTYCNCFDPATTAYSSNPYILGTKGNWRPVKSLTYLTDRQQTNYQSNTDIRRDGIFNQFTPYYRYFSLQHGLTGWLTNPGGWTYVSEVTEYSPNGMTLETQDALGRYSASKYGFNNTLTTAVAANSRLRSIETASFEDHDYTNCSDQQLFSGSGLNIIPNIAHTGYRSLKVTAGTPVVFTTDNDYCAPVGGCNIQLAVSQSSGTTLDILNGSGPYSMETQLLAGSGSAVLWTGDQIQITYNNQRNFELLITIRDSKGCTTTLKYKIPLGETDPQTEQQ